MSWSPIVELRQYTLHPGARETLVNLFDTFFLESQEELGMKVIGEFRDLDDPDRFTWLRGFPSMASRAESLKAFYTGPVWRAHAQEANATMIDSDDVLLLHPTRPDSAFVLPADRPGPGTTTPARGLVEAFVISLRGAALVEGIARLEGDVAGAADHSGGSLLASFVTEDAENNYPALPVREGEHVLVWFLGFGGQDARDLAEITRLASEVPGASGEVARLRLAPTSRSHLGDEAIALSARARRRRAVPIRRGSH